MMANEQNLTFAEADWPQKIEFFNRREQAFYANGIELVDLAEGRAQMRMTPRENQLNGRGCLPMAWATVLLEQTACMAAKAYGRYVVAEQLSVNYHQSMSAPGVLTAVATEKNRGKYLGVYTVDVTNAEGLVTVSGTVTVYFEEREISFDDSF